MSETLDLEFSMRLGRANRSELAELSGMPLAKRAAVADGQVNPTLSALVTVLEEIGGLSVLSALAEPVIEYEVEDPSDAELFSESTMVTVRLSITTSKAHQAALATWAARPPSAAPLLFEPEMRAAIRALGRAGIKND